MLRRTWRPALGVILLTAACAPARAETPAPMAASEARHASTAADTGSVSVTGTATVRVPADRARVRFAVETEGTTAAQAATLNAEQMDQAMRALRDALGSTVTLETAGYNISPVYRQPPRDEGGQPRIVGYRATNQLVATLNDVERVGTALDAAVAAGVNRVAGLSFYAEDTREARLEALRQAAQKAHEEARVLADALGVALGEPLEVHTSADVSRVRNEIMMRAAADMMEAATPVEAGEQDVVANVSIRYRLGGR